jgi:putative ABC transport system permease protein
LDAALNPSGVQSKGNPNVATVQTHHSIVARRQSNWYVLYYLLYAVAAVVGVAGSVGLANALAASALERQREIGMMRAMGASGRQVAWVLWIEGLALGAGAWLVGALVGILLAHAFVAEVSALVEPVDFHTAPIAFVVMLVAIWGIATAASVIPSWRASRVRVADMLRYE